VVSLRRHFPSWGRERLGLALSGPTIDRIPKEEGLIKPRRRRYKRKRDLREVKARLNPFEKLSVDVKELRDIPNYYPAMIRHRLPRYQYTARDIRTGAVFICYGYENNSTNATYFLAYLAHQLREYAVQVEEANLEVVTDNGPEFSGGAKAIRPGPFTRLAEEVYHISHYRIPPRSPTFDSDVENFHSLVEAEFYDVEGFEGMEEFLAKAYAYQLYFSLRDPVRKLHPPKFLQGKQNTLRYPAGAGRSEPPHPLSATGSPRHSARSVRVASLHSGWIPRTLPAQNLNPLQLCCGGGSCQAPKNTTQGGVMKYLIYSGRRETHLVGTAERRQRGDSGSQGEALGFHGGVQALESKTVQKGRGPDRA